MMMKSVMVEIVKDLVLVAFLKKDAELVSKKLNATSLKTLIKLLWQAKIIIHTFTFKKKQMMLNLN